MISNYLKLAVRLLIRNPFFAIINVVGLAVGFASFFGLWNYAVTELKSDQFHANHERIARLVTDWSWTDDNVTWGHMVIQGSPSMPIPMIKNDFPEIESFVRISSAVVLLSLPGSDDVYRETNTIYADSNLFEFFTIPLLRGTASNALRDQNSVVLSRKTANKIFGDKNPVNETVILNGAQTLKVTGVFEDLPNNTHLDFELVLSNQSLLQEWNSNIQAWSGNYVKLADPDLSGMEEKLNAKVDTYWAALFKEYPAVKATMLLLPLADAAFVSSADYWNYQMKSRVSLQIMAAIGLVVLIMSWINYINLTISRTAKRMKEVATRKISGAGAFDLMMQFLIEALVTNVLAVTMAFTILQLVRQPLDVFLKIHIGNWSQIDGPMAIFFALVVVVGVTITGLYPALSSYTTSPTRLFFMHSKSISSRILPSFLTTSQYTFAVVFTFCALALHHQLRYIFNKDLGFDKSNVLFIDPALRQSENYTRDLQNFKVQMMQQADIKGALITSQLLDLSGFRNPSADLMKLDGVITEENFITLFKHKLIAGRDFIRDDREDVVILTQHAVERFGYTLSDAVGRTIYVGDNKEAKEIVGVIENFRLTPFLKSENTEVNTGRGTVLIYSKPERANSGVLILKLANDKRRILADVERMYKNSFPGNAFSGFYFEDILRNPYNGEQTLRSQVSFFTFLAIGIACLGLLGMMANKVVEKTREIGIRKALGAGVKDLADVLLRSAIYHLVFAIAVGLALAYYLSVIYLERYSERISLNVLHFVIPILLLVGIMVSTISVLLFRAFSTNPVEELRHE